MGLRRSSWTPVPPFLQPQAPAEGELLLLKGGAVGGIRGKEGEQAILVPLLMHENLSSAFTPAVFNTFNTARPGQDDGEQPQHRKG